MIEIAKKDCKKLLNYTPFTYQEVKKSKWYEDCYVIVTETEDTITMEVGLECSTMKSTDT